MNPADRREWVGMQLAGMPPQDRHARMLAVSTAHYPSDHSALFPTSCWECGHEWPCLTYRLVTGLGDD